MPTRSIIVSMLVSLVLVLVGCGSGSSSTRSAASSGSPADRQPATASALITAVPLRGTTVRVAGGSYIDLAPPELSELLRNKSFPLINVHIPYEGELEQTDAFIPYNEITRRLEALPADKNAPIVLYCRSGRMSMEASRALVSLGYTHVMNLAGGMQAWEAAGYNVRQKR